MKHGLLAILLSMACVVVSPLGAHAATLSYPSAEKPIVLVDHPDDWTTKPASQNGDYADLYTPKGTTIQVRTFPGTEADLAHAIEDGLKYAKEHFTDVEIVVATTDTLNGMASQITMMRAVDQEGTPKNLAMLFVAVEDDNIAEVWFAAPQDDGELDAFQALLVSFRKP